MPMWCQIVFSFQGVAPYSSCRADLIMQNAKGQCANLRVGPGFFTRNMAGYKENVAAFANRTVT
jgi:hypothetical protein